MKEKFKTFLKNQSEAWFNGPIEPQSIEKAESILNVKLPDSFRFFLNEYGYGDIAGYEIYGIFKDPEKDDKSSPNFVWMNLDERKDGHPDHLIIISTDGIGNFVCIDTSRPNEQRECPVIFWTPGVNKRSGNEEFENFYDWVFKELDYDN